MEETRTVTDEERTTAELALDFFRELLVAHSTDSNKVYIPLKEELERMAVTAFEAADAFSEELERREQKGFGE